MSDEMSNVSPDENLSYDENADQNVVESVDDGVFAPADTADDLVELELEGGEPSPSEEISEAPHPADPDPATVEQDSLVSAPETQTGAAGAVALDVIAQRWDEVVQLTGELDEIEAKLRKKQELAENVKASIKALEKEYDERVKELRAVIQEAKAGQGLLPFGRPLPPSAVPVTTHSESSNGSGESRVTDTSPGTPIEGTNMTLHTDETWRDVYLSELPGMPAAALNGMRDAGIVTVGQLNDWQNGLPWPGFPDAGNNGRELAMLGGIGPATADKVGSVMIGFWESRRKD